MPRFGRHETNQLIREAQQRGWRASRTNGGHVRLQHQSGAVVFTSSTPSDPRTFINTIAQMRRVERRAGATP